MTSPQQNPSSGDLSSGGRNSLRRELPVAAPALAGASPAGQREVFRLMPPLILWWVWLAFAVANVIVLSIQGSGRYPVDTVLIVILITGVAYALAFRPRVVVGPDGLQILNPLRNYRVPWVAVQGVEVGDWVRVRCSPGHDTVCTKVIDSWALFTPPRSRLKADRAARAAATGYATNVMSADAKRAATLPPAPAMAVRLDDRARQERARLRRATGRGATPSMSQLVSVRWAWTSLAAMILPTLALAIALAVG